MTGYEATETGVSFLLKTLRQFEYPSVFLFVVLAAFVMTVMFGRRKGRLIFVYPSLLVMLTVLNPYVFPFFLEGRADWNPSFYRMLWLLPMASVTGYGAVSVARALKSVYAEVGVVVLFAAAIALTGRSAVQDVNWVYGMDNPFGAETEYRNIADTVLSDAERDNVQIGFEAEETGEELRAIHPELRGMLIRSLSEQEQGEAAEERPEYYVLQQDSPLSEAAARQNLTKILETEHYLVFRG